MFKKLLAFGLCLFLLMPLAACQENGPNNPSNTSGAVEEPYDQQAMKMSTVMNLRAYGPKASEAIEAAYKRIDEIEQMASAAIETSDVSKINQAAGKEYVKVHPDIVKMIKASVKYSEISDGAFDISVGPLINLWGIGTAQERLPSDAEIKEKLALVGYKNIRINEAENSVKLMREGMSIDLGGIAKGYTADEVIKVFKEYGIKTALINLGGSSIYTMGQKPDGTLWSVAIQHPRGNEGDVSKYLGIIRTPQQAISTSGDYERFFIQDGKKYHHILNPFTGYPADTGVMSDTIIIDSSLPDCNMLADILTKLTFVSGVEKGLKIIDGLEGVACMAITQDKKIYKSAKWPFEVEGLSPGFSFQK